MIDPITLLILEKDEYDKRGENDIHAQIIKWFIKNENPTHDEVNEYAEELGLDDHELQNHIYMILSSIITGGLTKGQDIKHDPKELKKGIDVEYEHTPEYLIARKIAMDHLSEIPDYYTRLEKLEAEAEDYWKERRLEKG
jgi:hypothetical protein